LREGESARGNDGAEQAIRQDRRQQLSAGTARSLGKESPLPRPPQRNLFGQFFCGGALFLWEKKKGSPEPPQKRNLFGEGESARGNDGAEQAIRQDRRKQLSAGTARSLGKEKGLPRTPSKKKPDGGKEIDEGLNKKSTDCSVDRIGGSNCLSALPTGSRCLSALAAEKMRRRGCAQGCVCVTMVTNTGRACMKGVARYAENEL